MQKPVMISSQSKYRGRVVDFCSDRIKYSDGREYDLDMIRHPGAAGVVAIDQNGKTCLVRQYRHGIEDFLWEIPAGKLDPGEAPALAAIRELAEETGVIANQWKSLGPFFPAPGLMTEIVHLYLAWDLSTGAPRPDSDEELELQWLDLEQALQMTIDGRSNDGKTALGLMRARAQWAAGR